MKIIQNKLAVEYVKSFENKIAEVLSRLSYFAILIVSPDLAAYISTYEFSAEDID